MSLPHWDLSNIYPSLESPEFEEGFEHSVKQINALAKLFDAHNIARAENAVTDASTAKTFDAVITHYNTTLEDLYTLSSYINSFVTTDSRNTLAQAKLSALQQHNV